MAKPKAQAPADTSELPPTAPTPKIIPARDLQYDPDNANKGTNRGREMVYDSLTRNRAGRSIVVDKHGKVIAGNKTLAAYIRNGGTNVVVIPTGGDHLIVHQRDDLDLDTDPMARELAFADNRAAQVGIQFDEMKIVEAHESGIDLTAYWSGQELLELFAAAEPEPDDEGLVDEDGRILVDDLEDVPEELPGASALKENMIFEKVLPYDIPPFLEDMLAPIPEPLTTWAGDDVMEYDPGYSHILIYGYGFRGVNIANSVMAFYVDDSKFDPIWYLPHVYTAKLINAGVNTIISPNYSLWSDAAAVNIYNTFRARWMGRYFQEAGLKLIPDVNWADERSFEYCFLGIPKGCPAISIQIQTASEPEEIARLLTGITHAINEIRPESLLIYGGGKQSKETVLKILPRQLHTVWTPNRSEVRRPNISNRGMK